MFDTGQQNDSAYRYIYLAMLSQARIDVTRPVVDRDHNMAFPVTITRTTAHSRATIRGKANKSGMNKTIKSAESTL